MKLHLGSGPTVLKEYVNMDRENFGQEVIRDIRRGIPFNDETFDEIFTCHFLEHVPSGDDLVFTINEMYRVLKKGGKLIIRVPHSSVPQAFDPIHLSYWNEEVIHSYFTGNHITTNWSGINVKFDIVENNKEGIELKVVLIKK